MAAITDMATQIGWQYHPYDGHAEQHAYGDLKGVFNE